MSGRGRARGAAPPQGASRRQRSREADGASSSSSPEASVPSDPPRHLPRALLGALLAALAAAATAAYVSGDLSPSSMAAAASRLWGAGARRGLSRIPRERACLVAAPLPSVGARLDELREREEADLWGTYRPGTYFSMRPRVPKGPVVGVMWTDVARRDWWKALRNEALPGEDARVRWLAHDGVRSGEQLVADGRFEVRTSFAKRPCATGDNECGRGGDWGARATFARLPESEVVPGALPPLARDAPMALSAFFYVFDEEGGEIRFDAAALREALVAANDAEGARDGGDGDAGDGGDGSGGDGGGGGRDARAPGPPRSLPDALITGRSRSLRTRWTLAARVNARRGGFPLGVHTYAVRAPHLGNLSDVTRQGITNSLLAQRAAGAPSFAITLPDTAERGANLLVVQVLAFAPTELELTWVASAPPRGGWTALPGPPSVRAFGGGEGGRGGVSEAASSPAAARFLRRRDALARWALSDRLSLGAAAFERKVAAALRLPRFVAPQRIKAAQAAVAGVLGGLGYAHGAPLVRTPCEVDEELLDDPYDGMGREAFERLNPWGPPPRAPVRAGLALGPEAGLFSASPSRTLFPRGFLWDEGFHLLLVRRFDPGLARGILASWLDTQTATGWIPREQIRGPEARSRVPAEFVPQSPDGANPPSLFLAVEEAVEGAEHDPSGPDARLLEASWPRLLAWYDWLRASQAGRLPGSFRWRGRDARTVLELNPKTLTSGLDDAPRASHPTPDERHVDLLCWMAYASGVLARAGKVAARSGAARPADVARVAGEAFELGSVETLDSLHWDAEAGAYRDWGLHVEGARLWYNDRTARVERLVLEDPVRRFVPHDGYVGLFPLALRVIPPHHPTLEPLLRSLLDEGGLASAAGVRSLSLRSPLYGAPNTEHDPPYWRGAVWMPVNLLVIRALDHYSSAPGPHAALAARARDVLRERVVRTVSDSYAATGTFWEQYSDATAEGQRAHPFTGWTALFALLLEEPPRSIAS